LSSPLTELAIRQADVPRVGEARAIMFGWLGSVETRTPAEKATCGTQYPSCKFEESVMGRTSIMARRLHRHGESANHKLGSWPALE
jgi:hypothetical protein